MPLFSSILLLIAMSNAGSHPTNVSNDGQCLLQKKKGVEKIVATNREQSSASHLLKDAVHTSQEEVEEEEEEEEEEEALLKAHEAHAKALLDEYLRKSTYRSQQQPIEGNDEENLCVPTRGPLNDPHFLDKFKPCNWYAPRCAHLGYSVVEANTDYPGNGIAGDVLDKPYIVQFDIGVDPNVVRRIIQSDDMYVQLDTCVGDCPTNLSQPSAWGETCLEIVVLGNDDWGDLGVPDAAYDCMGTCGQSCDTTAGGTALDCLKHDVCSAYKTFLRQTPASGYCADPDCGDEGAQALYNCNRNDGWIRDTPVVCSRDPDVHAHWSSASRMQPFFFPGPCSQYEGWNYSQGMGDGR